MSKLTASLKRLAKRIRQRCWYVLRDFYHYFQGSRSSRQTNVTEEPVGRATFKALYNFFYFRDPDMPTMLLCKNMSATDVLGQVVSSNDFARNLPMLLSRSRASRFNSQLIENDYLFRANTSKYNQLIRGLIGRHTLGGEYRDYHFKRFVEHHSLISHLSNKSDIKRILDISFMPFTTGLYKHYIEGVEVCSIDLPASSGGPNKELLDSFGVDKHWEADLNETSLLELSSEIVREGFFDLVIATEIIEHLQVDFSHMCKFMVACAGPDGLCFVTTPNYLSSENVRQIAAGRSPQQRFLNFNANRGGHYHFREYTMYEIEEIIAESGFHVLWNMYSGCWEDPEDSELLRCAGRSYSGVIDVMRNMAIIFSARNRVLFDAGGSLA
jgi:hypothetical protein